MLEQYKNLYNSKAELLRHRAVKELLSIYYHRWNDLLEKELAKLFSEEGYKKLRKRCDTSTNPLRWVVTERSKIYSRPPLRSLPYMDAMSDEEVVNFERYEAGGELDLSLAGIMPLLELCREVFVRPKIINRGTKEDPNFVQILDVLTPDKVSVQWSQADPLSIDAIVYRAPNRINARGQQKERYHVWTDSEFYILDKTWELQQDEYPKEWNPGENPYGCIPWIPFFASYPVCEQWHHEESNGLKEATIQHGIRMTDHAHLRHYQSYKQIVAFLQGGAKSKNNEESQKFSDPSSIMTFTGQGSASVLDMQANLSGHLDTALQALESVIAFYDQHPDGVRGKEFDGVSSGYAIKLKSHRREQVWESLRNIMLPQERRLYNLCRKMWAYHTDNAVILPEGELQIEWAELGPAKDPSEEANYHKSLMDLGYPFQYILQLRGHTDEEIALIMQWKLEEQQSAGLLDIPAIEPPAETELDNDLAQDESTEEELNV